MKRLRSSEDLHSYGEKNAGKDSNLSRSFSSSQRSFYYKPDSAQRKGSLSSSSSSSRYDRDRAVDEDRESLRLVRKRSEHDFQGFDRRKGFDRYRDGGGYGGGGGGGNRSLIHRSESFCGGSRREFPKGFRSERDRPRREGSVSSWRRGLKDFDESNNSCGRGGNSRASAAVEEKAVVRSPKVLRDVKSPTWSKDSESDQSKKRSSSSPRLSLRDAKSKSKSPTWSSKDSESEQSKSVEQSKSIDVKKTEELQVQSGSSSEMEEGELEPEPVQLQAELEKDPNAVTESEDHKDSVPMETDEKEIRNECNINDTDTAVDERKESAEEKSYEEIVNVVKDAKKEVDNVPDVEDETTKNMVVTETVVDAVHGDDNKKEECLKADVECREEIKKSEHWAKQVVNEVELKQDKDADVKAKTVLDKPELNDEVSAENEVPKEANRELMVEGLINIAKDKGKSVSVTNIAQFSEDTQQKDNNGLWNGGGLRDVTSCSADFMDGPSTRGFELFSRSPVRKVEKTGHSVLNKRKDDSHGMEQLDLCLSLPNVLLPIGATETTAQAPGSPSQALQSLSNTFCTNSDGFTASMSFSGSQSFNHNPSCSLTKNSMDFEQSVGSRPLFGGIDWQAQSQNDPKQDEVPFSQKNLMNGNGSLYQPQASWGVLDGQAVKGQHSRVLEGNSKMGSGLDRQLSFQKQLSGQSRRHDVVRSPIQSVGSHDIGSNYSFEKKREARDRVSSSLYQSTSQKDLEQILMGGVDFVETIIARLVSEPVHAMSKKFHEMTGQAVACLKEGIREIMLNADKHGQILAFQKVLQNRSDINLEVLLKCHRVQLEILVALKTGLTHYLQLENSISSDLAQVFLNLRCRNLSCRSQLPVDECDCKVCMQKNGFCRDCMCLVCSKFDNASNTCSWVGCDVCLHWCHTDCGLQESYIRNGHSTTGSRGTTEMQFHCIACDHPSEMFGFVKEVFYNFAKDWSVETLCKELEYVKRIFSASKDIRGRQLHEITDQMLPRLANKSKLPEVLRHIMSFLSDGDSSKLAMGTNLSGKEQIKEINGVAGPSQEPAWLKSIYSEKRPLLERPSNILPSFDHSDKRTLAQELQMSSSVQKDLCFDELESIVKIKQAEAKMFQTHADNARREAEGLKRIALAKNEKIDKEYTNRIAKLRFSETEEMRRQKLEELQGLERAHLEYFNMKMRMEADIKDLLSKMEATKRSLSCHVKPDQNHI